MDLQIAKEIASKIAIEAGTYCKDQFEKFEEVSAKGVNGDVVTEVDYGSESIIIRRLTERFPHHRIHSEETGDNGIESDWLWLVDPLDGTNNYAIGMPLFSVSLSLMYNKQPLLAVIYEPMVERLYVSLRNEGTFVNAVRVTMPQPKIKRNHLSIGWIQGHHVLQDPVAVRLRQHLDTNCKRMIRTWAPTLQWNLLAKGGLDAIVLYDSEGDDLYSGMLMVKEAGGIIVDFNGDEVKTMRSQPKFIACHPARTTEMVKLVRSANS